MCYCGSCSSRFCCVLGFDRAKNVYIIVDFEELVYCFASKAVFNRLQYNYVRRGVLYFGAIFLNFGRPSHPRINNCFINNYYAKFVLSRHVCKVEPALFRSSVGCCFPNSREGLREVERRNKDSTTLLLLCCASEPYSIIWWQVRYCCSNNIWFVVETSKEYIGSTLHTIYKARFIWSSKDYLSNAFALPRFK